MKTHAAVLSKRHEFVINSSAGSTYLAVNPSISIKLKCMLEMLEDCRSWWASEILKFDLENACSECPHRRTILSWTTSWGKGKTDRGNECIASLFGIHSTLLISPVSTSSTTDLQSRCHFHKLKIQGRRTWKYSGPSRFENKLSRP